MAVSDSGPDTVNKKLLYWSKTQPDKPAFIFHNPATATNKRLVFTRADIFTLASRYAAILRREGIRQGDVVCNTLPNSPERLLTDLGIMLAGAVAMNSMVFLSDGADFVGSIRRGRCVAVIVDPKEKSNQPLTVLERRFRSRAGHTVDCPDAPLLKTLLFVDSGVGQDGDEPFLEQLRNENESFVADVKPENLAYIFATSGSTGISKLVPRTHAEYLLLGKTYQQIVGGQPVSKRYVEAARKVADTVVIVLGSTECGPVTMKVVDGDNIGDYEDGNSGLPVPGMEIKLVDENQQEVVEPGQTGEVLCRGPSVFTGYLGMDQAAQDNVFTHDGWFRTTDVGFRNSKGELHVICRNRASVTEEEIREFCKTLYVDPEGEAAAVPSKP
nr:hypothetical protein BaRGS_004796 [Batillaria attramentaria]